jgi:adenylate kinase
MRDRYRTILLFGAPGSGKGTQGRILGTVPDFFYFACGDAFRNLRIDDPIGKIFIEYSSRGLLVPDETTISLWSRNIQASTVDGSFNPTRDTLVLDGIPRNPKQAEMLKDTLDVKGLLHLSCLDQPKMIERLQRRALRENRLDDANLDVIKKRLETYENETKPVLDYYGDKMVHHIDSSKAPVEVLREILNTIVRL